MQDYNSIFINIYKDDKGQDWTNESKVFKCRDDAINEAKAIDEHGVWRYQETVVVNLLTNHVKIVDLPASRDLADKIRSDLSCATARYPSEYRSTKLGDI